jgi:glycosyltransferase involved in cell wall biosynthesis
MSLSNVNHQSHAGELSSSVLVEHSLKAEFSSVESSYAPSIVILMCTYNGSKFIKDQLDSFTTQTFKNWRLIVSDDGSTDNTLSILNDYQAQWGRGKLEIRNGPKRGYAANFLSLCSDTAIEANFYAFSDQDDVWLPKKLQVAVDYLSTQNQSRPHAYGGRTIYTDASLNKVGLSKIFAYPRSFRNAFVQSIAGGNTIVFNQKTKVLFESAGVLDIVSHDWWTYMLVEGAGGHLFYDSEPYILYRQHDDSIIGANRSLISKARRFYSLLKGQFKAWNTINANALLEVREKLEPHNVEVVEEFLRMRDASIGARLRMLDVCGLFRQGWQGQISLLLSIVLKKI